MNSSCEHSGSSAQEYGDLRVSDAEVTERPCLACTVDEESSQYKALNLLFGPLHLRGFPQPEFCHPLWNDCSRALLASGLKGAVLKGTILINHHTGPYRSGRFGFEARSLAKKLALTVPPQFFDDVIEIPPIKMVMIWGCFIVRYIGFTTLF